MQRSVDDRGTQKTPKPDWGHQESILRESGILVYQMIGAGKHDSTQRRNMYKSCLLITEYLSLVRKSQASWCYEFMTSYKKVSFFLTHLHLIHQQSLPIPSSEQRGQRPLDKSILTFQYPNWSLGFLLCPILSFLNSGARNLWFILLNHKSDHVTSLAQTSQFLFIPTQTKAK